MFWENTVFKSSNFMKNISQNFSKEANIKETSKFSDWPFSISIKKQQFKFWVHHGYWAKLKFGRPTLKIFRNTCEGPLSLKNLGITTGFKFYSSCISILYISKQKASSEISCNSSE